MFNSTHLSLFRDLNNPAERSAAMNRFVDLYRPAILAWCRVRGLQDADGEDIAQAVLSRLMTSLTTFDPDHAGGEPTSGKVRFRGWLKAVVNNATSDFLKARARRPEGVAVGGSDFQDRMTQLSSDQALEELSTSLSEVSQRDPVVVATVTKVRSITSDNVWRAFEQTVQFERDVHDVAQELGMTVGSVYQAKYRVQKLLKRTYQELISAAQ
ncbi:MAG: sigma-70 family RNA polymerase sigma factor [Planctomycetaceae bacterium]|nr:sigma-70 family RNA polymerase sigma factor [Planctomycetaceae bacterium]MCA9065855.1 sigma-70 family RNA polymerase sigma factor [Planctomycetaceae bacterium]